MYFSVFRDIKIAGKVYRPCVSYPVKPELKATVESLVLQGKAVLRDEDLRFANGAPVYPGKEKKEEAPAPKKTTTKKGK